jgi:uncharacterized protein YprB with RNaseH-like and TPR domain
MANLRDRLKRIQEQKGSETSRTPKPLSRENPADISFFAKLGWKTCGYMSLKRQITASVPADLPEKLPLAQMILVPDLERICGNGRLPKIEDFLFFDLETSGLSGGAGTVAFLAAFGNFIKNHGGYTLHITQYLLLDYPGENDFLEALLGEFNNEERIIVSYNGKCFDSQILKTRCLMNKIQSPAYFHADLLHPARRLWKTVLEDCSQATIETGILGLDRTGDIPGALAPEIWFDFLKTGNAERLMGICDHNSRDIFGLAAILCAMSAISADPLGTVKIYRYDIEKLALRWRSFLRQANVTRDDMHITGDELIRLAVKQKYPRASLVYALDQLRSGAYSEGRKLLLRICAVSFPENIRAAALRALAIDSEHRLKDPALALEFTLQGLELHLTGSGHKEFERRVKRLRQKKEAGSG